MGLERAVPEEIIKVVSLISFFGMLNFLLISLCSYGIVSTEKRKTMGWQIERDDGINQGWFRVWCEFDETEGRHMKEGYKLKHLIV